MIEKFEEYENLAMATAVYPRKGNNLLYPALKLAGEAGEFADKVGKYWRNSGVDFITFEDLSSEQLMELIRELGDVQWYLAACAKELKTRLEMIAFFNIKKLQDRNNRGVIKSEGDNR